MPQVILAILLIICKFLCVLGCRKPPVLIRIKTSVPVHILEGIAAVRKQSHARLRGIAESLTLLL